jgi:hypothetical protein
MASCSRYSDIISDRGPNCANCRASVNSPSTPTFVSKPQLPSQKSPAPPSASNSIDLSTRLERAMRRAELLGYAASGLAIAILFAIIAIAFV